MAARKKTTPARSARRVLIEEMGRKKKVRTQRKTIYMTDELGDWVKQTATVAELEGRELSQSDIFEVAIGLLRDTVENDPKTFIKKLAA